MSEQNPSGNNEPRIVKTTGDSEEFIIEVSLRASYLPDGEPMPQLGVRFMATVIDEQADDEDGESGPVHAINTQVVGNIEHSDNVMRIMQRAARALEMTLEAQRLPYVYAPDAFDPDGPWAAEDEEGDDASAS